jgi:hypothetical protein
LQLACESRKGWGLVNSLSDIINFLVPFGAAPHFTIVKRISIEVEVGTDFYSWTMLSLRMRVIVTGP